MRCLFMPFSFENLLTTGKEYTSIIVLFFFIFFSGCDSISEPAGPQESDRGKIIQTELTGTFNTQFITGAFSFTGEIDGFTPLYNVTVYRVVYYTLSPDNQVVQASGAIFVPGITEAVPMVSVQHGTQTLRTGVASENPLNGFEGIISASLGYYTVMPDYLGLGISEILHPYHHAKSSADCVIDIIRAGKTFADNNNISTTGEIFLTGYSEGGYVTLAAHKEIDENYLSEINLTAVSAMAGAYNLLSSSTNVIREDTYEMPGYIAFLMTAYNDIYNWDRINEIFNEPYASRIPLLFDGTKTIPQINAQLTNSVSALFKNEFIDAVINQRETDLINAFIENSLIDWTPVTPLLLVHGNADEYVPYENSTEALQSFRNRGATNVELITIEGGTHATAVIPSILATINWFEQIRARNYYYALR